MPVADFQSLSSLLKLHATLNSIHDDGDKGNFLSGWQCINPWIDDIQKQVDAETVNFSPERYTYIEEDDELAAMLLAMQSRLDGTVPEDIIPGSGATTLVFAFCAWLKHKGFTQVYYLPPLYFTMHFALNLFGVRARPISGLHGFEKGFGLDASKAKGILLLCDPIWYTGVCLRKNAIESIRAWQEKTGGIVFIDGSFQYMRWDLKVHEETATLNPSRTFRLISPTKMLGAHGYRFAYATMPKSERIEFRFVYNSIYGAVSPDVVRFSRVAVKEVERRTITNSLMEVARTRHQLLRANAITQAEWQAECGYFVFEKLLRPLPSAPILMDGGYFEQKRFKDNRRINLLSPSIDSLLQKS